MERKVGERMRGTKERKREYEWGEGDIGGERGISVEEG